MRHSLLSLAEVFQFCRRIFFFRVVSLLAVEGSFNVSVARPFSIKRNVFKGNNYSVKTYFPPGSFLEITLPRPLGLCRSLFIY